MDEQHSSLLRKRNVLIGGGIAIAAALVALSYTIDFPPGAQNTVGTIVPAQRFHAAQPTAEEIKVGGQGATQSVPLQAGSAANAFLSPGAELSCSARRPRSIATRREARACWSIMRVTGAAVSPP